MLTITPGQAVVLPVTGGDFPGNPGLPESGEIWDLLWCPAGVIDFNYDIASNLQPRGCSVVYDATSNTLTVTMASLESLQAYGASDYGTWAVVYDTQPGVHHVAGAGRSAFFQFAAEDVEPGIPVPALAAAGLLIANAPVIRVSGH